MVYDSSYRHSYDFCTSRAYRFLAFALVTKVAQALNGITLFRMALQHEDGAMTLGAEAVEPGFLAQLMSALAAADTPIWVLTQIFAGIWLWRASASGILSTEKGTLPRKMGIWLLIGLVASALADLSGFVSAAVETFLVVRSATASQSLVPIVPSEYPRAVVLVMTARLAVVATLQVVLILVFRRLIVRTLGESPATADPVAAPPVPTEPTATAPTGNVAESEKSSEPEKGADESGEDATAGFGWPQHPTR